MAKKIISEDKLQQLIVRHINLNYPDALYNHCPNGGKRALRSAIKFKLLGVRAGVPDLLLFDRHFNFDKKERYNGLAIELKVGNNEISDAQAAWLNKLEERGWKVEVCYDYNSAISIIDEYYSNLAYE